jgi:hypothetical protein
MNFDFDKWKLFTGRLYTSIVVAYPTWYVISKDMPITISFAVEDKLESYDLNSKGT